MYFVYLDGRYLRRCKRKDSKHTKKCKPGPHDVEVCGPTTATDTEACCEKIRVAEEKKCAEKQTRKTKQVGFLRRRGRSVRF